MPDSIRKTALYRGRVQGVGFRFTTSRIAAQFDVTGFVRNLSDGRVELIAEGAVDQVDGLLSQVERTLRDKIERVDVDTRDASGEFSGFSIRY